MCVAMSIRLERCNLQAIELLLLRMGVPYLTTPAMAAVAIPLWVKALGFRPLATAEEQSALELRQASVQD